MYAFLCNFTPISVNAKNIKNKKVYYTNLMDAFRRYQCKAASSTESLYGFVYYFYRVKTQLDADNLSKPIWDALINVAFSNDNQIRFRSAGLFDLQSEGIDELDVTNMPDNILIDFLQMIDDKKSHILYVEFGKFDNSLIQFGHAK
jgi:hypothetical protein